MKPSSELHELICSLSPNEKGYFKKYCQRSGSTSRKYLQLFDAIAAQKEYDEAKLKKKLADPVLVRNLSSEKNYLLHLILEALISGNTMQDPAHETNLLLSKARWLAAHSFHESAERFAKKARAFATENELFTTELDALDLEWLLWQYLPQQDRPTLEEITEYRKQVIHKLIVTDELRSLDIRLIRLFQQKGIGRDQASLEEYRKLFDESIAFAKQHDPLPVRAKCFLHNISVFYHNASGEAEKSLSELNELLRLLESNSVIRKERLSFYISSLNNLILLHLHLGNYEEVKNKIDLLYRIETETQNQRNTVFITLYNTRFDLYTHTHNWEAAYELSKELRKEFPDFEDKIDNRYTGHIRFAAFRSCFYFGQYKEALYWINQLVQKTAGEPFKTELLMIARICELIIHETLGNYDLLETLLSSASRYLEKNHALYQFEKLTLEFLNERLDDPEKIELLENYERELTKIEADLLEQRVFTYFDFRAWVQARQKNCAIAELLKN